jgi:hypothetical protein
MLKVQRKYLLALTVLSCIALPIQVVVYAQDGAVFLNPDISCVMPFDTFEVNIEVDAGLTGIHCFMVSFNFDSSLIELLDVLEGPLLSAQGQTFPFWNNSGDTCVIGNCLLSYGLCADGPGVLAIIKFRALKSAGISALAFNQVDFTDTLLEAIDVTYSDGSVNIIEDQNPIVEVLSPATGEYYMVPPNLSINLKDDDGLDRGYYQIDDCEDSWVELWSYNSASSDTTIDWTVPDLSEGIHNLYFKVTDDAGNANDDTCIFCWSLTLQGECQCEPGNVNSDTVINIFDITYLISSLYLSGPAPVPYELCSGDPNRDCICNIFDVTYLISHLYLNGPPVCTCEDWVSSCGQLTKDREK